MNRHAERDVLLFDADAVLSDPSASFWLKAAVQDSLGRDPIDALNDALVLVALLDQHLRRLLELDDGS